MMERWDEITTGQTMRVEVAFEPAPNELPEMEGHHIDASTGEDEMALAEINARIAAGEFAPQALMPAQMTSAPARDPNDPSTWGKVARNEACPCGSGKKYKHCHGALV